VCINKKICRIIRDKQKRASQKVAHRFSFFINFKKVSGEKSRNVHKADRAAGTSAEEKSSFVLFWASFIFPTDE